VIDATTNVLTEYATKPFPMVHTGPGGASRLPGSLGINRSALRDEAHRQFFRKVDDALAAVQKEDHLPLVLVGVDRHVAFYQCFATEPPAGRGGDRAAVSSLPHSGGVRARTQRRPLAMSFLR